jgi:hypothetical protein
MKKSEALKTLGLADGATDEEVKKAHRKLVIENHPDKFGQDAEARAKAEEKTKLINEARDVLLNRSWDPEYSTQGTPYGAPFSYNPYTATHPGTGQTQGGANPYAGWPFGSETFVWTSWDENGNKTTYTTTSANPFGNSQAENPFAWTDPFRAGRGGTASSTGSPFVDAVFNSFFNEPKTKEDLLKEAKADLRLDIGLVVAKAAILALAVLLGAPATGVFLYTIISIGQGIWKRLSFLSLIFLVPFAMLAIIFTPGADAAIGIFAALLFVCSVGFDISNIYHCVQRIMKLKKM